MSESQDVGARHQSMQERWKRIMTLRLNLNQLQSCCQDICFYKKDDASFSSEGFLGLYDDIETWISNCVTMSVAVNPGFESYQFIGSGCYLSIGVIPELVSLRKRMINARYRQEFQTVQAGLHEFVVEHLQKLVANAEDVDNFDLHELDIDLDDITGPLTVYDHIKDQLSYIDYDRGIRQIPNELDDRMCRFLAFGNFVGYLCILENENASDYEASPD